MADPAMTGLAFFPNSLWPGLITWIVLYISDYSLTLSCARLYRSGVDKTVLFEGSFELTPYYQKDIDQLRVVSPRFVRALIFSSVWLALVWWLAMQSEIALYQCGLGAMILIELAIHIRHVRNLFLFRSIIKGNAVRGQIRYSRPIILKVSAVELAAFAGLFAVIFAFTRSWFVLGGALSCMSTAIKHLRLASRCQSNHTAPQVEYDLLSPTPSRTDPPAMGSAG
jgi:hypothetical protein